jgi:phosphopentomutase
MARALIIVLDSLGCGGAPDAAAFGDEGANTLGHVALACARGQADNDLRSGPLRLPNLTSLGLGLAAQTSTGDMPSGLDGAVREGVRYGAAIERSHGKDTPSGHWEIAGAPLASPFGLFRASDPAFPPELIAAVIQETGIPGILGDCHSAGIEALNLFGEDHLTTGKPIFYTSTDSVLQIAAHEESFGLERLYDLCRSVRRLVDPLNIGRVIARPFIGSARTGFQRTPRRKDFAMPAPAGNMLDRAFDDSRALITIGKIGDIFSHRNTGRELKAISDMSHFDQIMDNFGGMPDGGLMFANLVDLDTEYGHRRDVAGYACALEALDRRFADLLAIMREGDLCIVTADHGNDPTWRGTDHTRENIPILAFAPGGRSGSIGLRSSFADIGASVAEHLGLKPTIAGKSWI